MLKTGHQADPPGWHQEAGTANQMLRAVCLKSTAESAPGQAKDRSLGAGGGGCLRGHTGHKLLNSRAHLQIRIA